MQQRKEFTKQNKSKEPSSFNRAERRFKGPVQAINHFGVIWASH